MSRAHLLAVALILFIASPAAAQWTTYTNMNTVRALAVDPSRGDLWGATSGGALQMRAAEGDTSFLRVDNTDGLASVDLMAVEADSAGRLYFGTNESGLSVRFPDGTFRRYTVLDGLPNDQVLSVTIAGDRIWIGSRKGAVEARLEGRFLSRTSSIFFGPPLELEVRDIAVLDTLTFFATSDGLWRRTASNALRQYGVAQGLISKSVRRVVRRDATHVWVAEDGGVQILDVESEELVTVNGGLGAFLARQVADLAVGEAGTWIATQGGVFRFDEGGLSWEDMSDGLTTLVALSVAELPGGAVAVGLSERGIALRSGAGWRLWTFEGPGSNNLSTVVIDPRGVVWTGSWSVSSQEARGVSRFDGSRWQVYTEANSDLLFSLVSSLAVGPDTTIWIGSPWHNPGTKQSGLSILDDGGTADLSNDTWRTFTGSETGLSGDAIRGAVAFKGRDEAWIDSWEQFDRFGLPGGLDLLTYGPSTATFRSFGTYLTSRVVNSLAFDQQGTLWIGLAHEGVDVFVLRPVNPQGDSALFPLDPAGTLLVDPNVNHVRIDAQNTLWVATTGGVTHLDFGSDPLSPGGFVWRNFTRDNSGLPDVQVNRLDFWGDRFVFFATPSGVGRYDRADDTWEVLTPENSGLAGEQVFDVVVDTERGAAWFATNKGLSRLDLLAAMPVAQETGTIAAAPNPFRPAGVVGGVNLGRLVPGSTLEIFTVSGRPVLRARVEGEVFRWDGSDGQGVAVPSGVYVVVARAPGGEVSRGKVAVIR